MLFISTSVLYHFDKSAYSLLLIYLPKIIQPKKRPTKKKLSKQMYSSSIVSLIRLQTTRQSSLRGVLIF